jgi:hypothetical protein
MTIWILSSPIIKWYLNSRCANIINTTILKWSSINNCSWTFISYYYIKRYTISIKYTCWPIYCYLMSTYISSIISIHFYSFLIISSIPYYGRSTSISTYSIANRIRSLTIAHSLSPYRIISYFSNKLIYIIIKSRRLNSNNIS